MTKRRPTTLYLVLALYLGLLLRLLLWLRWLGFLGNQNLALDLGRVFLHLALLDIR